jgi:hypothetical protein
MSVKMRQEVEKKIFKQAIQSLLAAGFAVSIDNGGDDEYEIKDSTDLAAIIKASNLTDEERVYVRKLNEPIARGSHFFGWVFFVYGNDGWDVISDYTINLEPFIGDGTKTDKLARYYEE